MAWGFWNKIKQGFSKVGRAIVKGANWVNDKIIKPFKPVIKEGVRQLGNSFSPELGNRLSQAVDTVSDGIDFAQDVNQNIQNRNWQGLSQNASQLASSLKGMPKFRRN